MLRNLKSVWKILLTINFPEFRRLLYFLVYFDRFVSICLFLWILICFSESEPLVLSSLAKTHQVVKLKRRPQWWQNAFVGYVNWREALKHIHYLLAIIESNIFVRSLVASLVVSHHWRRRCHLITYCSSASCCKEVRSPCFLFTLHGHIVKLVTASNFTRILTNENVSPDSSCGLSVFVVCFTSAIPIPWWYKAIIFLIHCKDYELISWPQPCCLFLLFYLVCSCALCFVFVFVVCFLHGDSTMDYASIQSVLFWLQMIDRTEVATDLIRWICKMQLYFRFVKRPGKSHLALDGKKWWILVPPLINWPNAHGTSGF